MGGRRYGRTVPNGAPALAAALRLDGLTAQLARTSDTAERLERKVFVAGHPAHGDESEEK